MKVTVCLPGTVRSTLRLVCASGVVPAAVKLDRTALPGLLGVGGIDSTDFNASSRCHLGPVGAA